MNLPRGSRLFLICLHLAIGASIWGYNIGILSSILVHPGWRKALSFPSPSEKGSITGLYYLGTLSSYLFVSHPLADKLGRRYAALIGTGILSLGAICMASAKGENAVSIMVFGRIICGLGVGVISTGVPLYQSEVSPAQQRGKFVTMNHVGFVAGLATGLWAGYFITFWKTPFGEFWGWRVLVLLQLIPAFVFAVGLPYLPESPRWLVEKGHVEKAHRTLAFIRGSSDDSVSQELRAITQDVTAHHRKHQSSTLQLTLALFRSPALFARVWRAFLLQFMSQICGATVMKYYLPMLLEALGIGTQLALMAGAIEMTIKIGMTVLEMWFIDKFGRRVCLVAGSAVMGVAMLINGTLPSAYPNNISKAADGICIAFIFIYAMGYSFGLGPATWVYSSEIFPTTFRARGLNFAASGGSVGSLLVAQIWPVGLAKLGSGVYFFFMVVNFVCVPIIWRLYPETKGRALEDMDALFGPQAKPTSLNAADEAQSEDDEHSEDAPLLG